MPALPPPPLMPQDNSLELQNCKGYGGALVQAPPLGEGEPHGHRCSQWLWPPRLHSVLSLYPPCSGASSPISWGFLRKLLTWVREGLSPLPPAHRPTPFTTPFPRWLCGIRDSAASCHPVWHSMPDVPGKGQLIYTSAVSCPQIPQLPPRLKLLDCLPSWAL